MTYDELKTQIADFLNRSDLTSKLDFFIDATEGELNRRLRTKDMVVRATATADGQYLSLPTDWLEAINIEITSCLLYTSPSPRDATLSRMPSSA